MSSRSDLELLVPEPILPMNQNARTLITSLRESRDVREEAK